MDALEWFAAMVSNIRNKGGEKSVLMDIEEIYLSALQGKKTRDGRIF